jgi:hypothetical protein
VALILSLLPGLAADSLGAVVAPVWTFDVVAGQDENPVVAVVRVLFFLSVALSLALASGLWLRGRGFSPGASVVQGVALLAVPVVLAVLSSSAPPPVLREDHPPRTCARTDGVEVCVHAARAPVLGPLTQAVADRLDRASPPAVQAFLARHSEALQDCRASSSMLP